MAGSPRPFGNPLWANLQKVRLNKHRAIEAPVKANGTDGIVIGDPPLGVASRQADQAGRTTKPGLLARFSHWLASA